MEQEKRLKGTKWQPSHAEQSWAELRTDRTYTKVSVEAEDEIVIAGKKPPIVPQSTMNTQTCKPFPGHNISFYIFFGRTAVLSSSLACSFSHTLCSTAFSVVLFVWVCCARPWIWSGLKQKKKTLSPPPTNTQEKATGEKNPECQIAYFENCKIPPKGLIC